MVQTVLLCLLLGLPCWESPSPVRYEDTAHELFLLCNRARQTEGLPALIPDTTLTEIAGGHSLKMARSGMLRHRFRGMESLSRRMERVDLYFSDCGENIASSRDPDAPGIHLGWMASDAHRANILNPRFTHCGICVVGNGKTTFVTQILARLMMPKTASEIEFHLQERLETWWMQLFQQRYVYHRDAKPYARETAARLVHNLEVQPPPVRWPRHTTFTLVYPEMLVIEERLKNVMAGMDIEGITIGAGWGRHPRFPGGTCAVYALLFGRHFIHFQPETLIRMMLQSLNQLRARTRAKVLRLDDAMSRRARKFLGHRAAANTKPRIRDVAGHTLGIFTTVNPRLVPDSIVAWMSERIRQQDRVGIAVSRLESSDPATGGLRFVLVFRRD